VTISNLSGEKGSLKVLLNYWLANIPGYFKLSLPFPKISFFHALHSSLSSCHTNTLPVKCTCKNLVEDPSKENPADIEYLFFKLPIS
jgi:hypothetical protein